MSELDDRIREGLERLAHPADGTEVIEEVSRRRRRYRVIRRAQVTTLVLGVLVGSAAGVWGLSRAFMGSPEGKIAAPADGSLIAFERRVDGRDRIFLVGEDGAVRPLPIPEGGDQADPDWSPDGRTIAFTSTSEGTNIWTVSPDGSDLRQITSGDDSEFDPTWSPDGNRIAFLRDELGVVLGSARVRLWVIDLTTGKERVLTTGPGDVHDPAWAPDADGERIAFVGDRDGDEDIYAVNVLKGSLDQLTEGEGAARGPAWSPDGTRIAYVREGEGLVVLDLRTGDEEVLVPGEVEGPTWSPDGSHIVYAARPLDAWLLHEVAVEDRRVELLWNTAIPGRSPSWQPAPRPTTGPTVGPSPTVEEPTCEPESEPFPGSYGPIDEAAADVLGDGETARVRIIADEERPPECRYFLSVELPEGGVFYAPVPPIEGVPSVPAILMSAEIEGEPGHEIVVDIGGPGHPHRTGVIYTFDGASLVAMAIRETGSRAPGYQPAPYVPLGGEFASGVDCAGDPRTIVITGGTFADGGQDDRHYIITRVFYRAEDGEFQDFDRETFTVEVGEERDLWPETDDDPFRSCRR